MEGSGLETACLASLQACRSPLGAWPSPPAAHSNNILANHATNSLLNPASFGSGVSVPQLNLGLSSSLALSHSASGGPVSYTHLMTPCSDNDNSNMSSDCGTSNISNTGGQNGFNDGGSNNNINSGMDGECGDAGVNSKNSRQNQVGSIQLHGESIVSLIIDNKERLCLAQISNTLLKEYSYNEIHNRRVALGITCVQCTPVQLEILRRAGAMPVSSRRCGMITKREAERLVRSFLEENTPPKLPDDFAFDVHHECGWGCRGFFEPSRYNSSRAKCIKCFYCNVYFSPNKFIFHFHRTPESKYSHPDAANFNSWRRHLKLFSGNDNEEIVYKWEDVKAMFNGGTRKRPFPSSSSGPSLSSSQSSSSSSMPSPGSHHPSHHANHSHSHLSPPSSLASTGRSSLSSSELSTSGQRLSGMYGGRSSHVHFDGGVGTTSTKKSKQTSAANIESNPYIQKHPTAPFVNPFSPYNWLAAASTGTGKAGYPFMAMNASQSMCFGFPQASHPNASQHPGNKDIMSDRIKNNHLSPASWIGRASAAAAAAASGAPPFPLSSMDLLWDKAFVFPQAAALGFRPGTYPPALMSSAVRNGSAGNIGNGSMSNLSMSSGSLMELSDQFNHDVAPNYSASEHGSSQNRMVYRNLERGEKVKDHMSAFKRVRPSSASPSSSGSPPPHGTPDDQDEVEGDCPEDVMSHTEQHNDSNNNYSSSGNNNTHDKSDINDTDREGDEVGEGSVCAEDLSTQREIEESEDIDVEEEEGAITAGEAEGRNELVDTGKETDEDYSGRVEVDAGKMKADTNADDKEPCQKPSVDDGDRTEGVIPPSGTSPRPGSSHSLGSGHRDSAQVEANVTKDQQSDLSDESETEAENQKQLVEMSPEELRDSLRNEVESRRKREKEVDVLKEELRDSLRNEVESRRKREKEVDVLKETFRQEVSREKSFREHMAQQLEMLREAHDALQNFSCGMLAGRRDVLPVKDSVPR
ncbi:ski family transcriptional corepressor 2 [Plakobranchus ocellatus]|uniref:Ski family transcriptional corepressor 2 n=1 Tax=Plakobranchus ocellatus TaxID=259542 RepID=A0AAV4B382_9GAST|nr:ski family transcriptional corepressor 2 [Plakobranchus ocellatus]